MASAAGASRASTLQVPFVAGALMMLAAEILTCSTQQRLRLAFTRCHLQCSRLEDYAESQDV